MDPVKIDQLTPGKDDWILETRVCRMWEAINIKNNNTVMGLELLLVDDQGNSIQGFIRPHMITKFKTYLEEGEVHSIKNFKVEPASMEYRVAPNDLRIVFNALTVIRKIGKGTFDIPRHVFFFVDADVHKERITSKKFLTDIIGCVVAVGDIGYLDNQQQTKKRHVELAVDRSGSIMNLTLWGGIADVFDGPGYVDAASPVVVAVTSTTIKLYKGEVGFATTTATRIYFNPDIPETAELKPRFTGLGHSIRILESNNYDKLSRADQMALNRKTIEEILQMVWTSSPQERVSTVLATIKGIKNAFGWAYIGCQCKKKVVESGDSYFCPSCNKICPYPSARYKLHLEVGDPTGHAATFVLFDEVAERLVRHPARKFVARLGIDTKDIPKEMLDLIGKTYVFRIKLTDYNLKDGMQDFTVAKVFELEKPAINEKKRTSPLGVEDAIHTAPKEISTPSAAGGSRAMKGGKPVVITPEKKERKRLNTGN